MAGDWLKIDCSLPEKPEVLAITVAMGWDDPDLTVGKLVKVWRWFDQHTVAGNATGVTEALLDRLIGVTGMCAAMASVGWLVVTDGGLSLPKFDRHNGKTAKERVLTAKRVANHKAAAKANANGNDDTVTDALPREEKRREEKKEQKQSADAVGFEDFWSVYPNKTGKKPAQAKWQAKRLDDIAGTLIADVVNRMNVDRKWREGFVPNPVTYLTQERWNDEVQKAAPGKELTEWELRMQGAV